LGPFYRKQAPTIAETPGKVPGVKS
jgi:hypothetical protein